MKISIEEHMLSIAHPHTTWLEPGEYEVVRFFSDDRVILDVTPPTSSQRQLTVVSLKKVRNEKNEDTDSSDT